MDVINNKYITNLKIISKINVNEKIYINNDQFIIVERNSTLLSLIRSLYGENRYKNIDQLSDIYNNIFSFINNQLNSKYLSISKLTNIEEDIYFEIISQLENICTELKNSISGLDSLKKTYNNDILIDSQLDDLITRIDAIISKVQKKIL